mmetsp:Transcript_17758/g.33361  ORF Transcript_17758/g.33361 Transcript_17758/m.33361 type:complete len:209 (-) Transcript_17758:499-1125(-)
MPSPPCGPRDGMCSTSPPVRQGSQWSLVASQPSRATVTALMATPVRQHVRCICSKKLRLRFFSGVAMGVFGVFGVLGVLGESGSSASTAESHSAAQLSGTVAWKRTTSPPPVAVSACTLVRSTAVLATSSCDSACKWKGSNSCPPGDRGSCWASCAKSFRKVDSNSMSMAFPSGSCTWTPRVSGFTGKKGSSRSGMTTARNRPLWVGS